MTTEERLDRLAMELESLRALAKNSTIFQFETKGDPPDRYTVLFRGRGISRASSRQSDITYGEEHKVDIRLPYAYPQRPPDLRWLTPLFHPNVSFSGFLKFSDLGLPWEQDLGLDIICERLWDVARLAYMDLENTSNHAAKNWLEGQRPVSLPVDTRPLSDKNAPTGANIIRYERRGEHRTPTAEANSTEDILFIGEDTPTPQLPSRAIPPVRRPPPGDDDIFFIGDDGG